MVLYITNKQYQLVTLLSIRGKVPKDIEQGINNAM